MPGKTLAECVRSALGGRRQSGSFASEESHQAWLSQASLFHMSDKLDLKSFDSLELAGKFAAEAEYTKRYCTSAAERSFVGASLVRSHPSTRNVHLHCVSMQVSEEGDGSCPGGFVLPWIFAIYERTPGNFVPLDQLFPGRNWSQWDDKCTPCGSIIKAQFRLFDENCDGMISLTELRNVIKDIALHHADSASWTDEKIETLLHVVDKNGDAMIDYDEFANWFFSVSSYETICEQPSFLAAAEKWIG